MPGIFLNVICGKIYNLEPKEYFLMENDDYRASLDMKIQSLMEEFVVIRNCSRPLKKNGSIDQNASSIFVSLYPDVPFHQVGAFRTVFAHTYIGIRYSNIWKFINNDLWKFYNFTINLANIFFDKNDSDPVVQEILNAKLLNSNDDIFTVDNISLFSGIGDISEKEINAQNEIIDEWERNHKKIKPADE